MDIKRARTHEATESGAALRVIAERLAEALESRRCNHEELDVACGVAWTLVDLLKEDSAS